MSDTESDTSQVHSKGWTEAKCIELIREYRGRDILWNPGNALYYKPLLKAKEWSEIGKKLQKPADTCKNKINILLSSFRREKSKILNSFAKGEIYTSVWFAFKELSFLMDKELSSKSRRTRIIEPDHNKDEMQEFQFDESAEDYDTVDETPEVKRRRMDATIEAINNTSEDYHDTYSEQSRSNAPIITETKSSHSNDEDDEMSTFLSFIGNKMKKYSNQLKTEVQQAICEIIFKTDQKYYNRANNVDPLSKIQKTDECDCICCVNRKY